MRKPGNMYASDGHDMTLAVKVVLNPNTYNQPINSTLPRIDINFSVTFILSSAKTCNLDQSKKNAI